MNDIKENLTEQTAEHAVPFSGIGADDIKRAHQILQRYKNGKSNLEARIIENEEWWRQRYADKSGDSKKASAWLFNSIVAKHADAMDNIPTCNLLPREKSDTKTAQQLSHIVPVVLERNHFEETYSDCWYDKLKNGTAVWGVFWNNMLEAGMGDVDVKRIDVLNLFWEPGVMDIQKSRNIFHLELRDNDLLTEEYPQMAGHTGGSAVDVAKYLYDDNVDTSEKSIVVDWYYKKMDGSREILHYCKFCNDVLLYSSENAGLINGWYEHGKYPFVFDTLYLQQGTPCGFGLIDVEKVNQREIDILNSTIIENAKMGAKRRFFVRSDGTLNEKEYADYDKAFVHYSGSGNPNENIMPIEIPSLPAIYVDVLNNKVQELKETSGTNDFSQGNTTSGVTAASAIAALQEAGSKTSRDMIKQSYGAFEQVVALVIELIRQFYNFPRYFRIIGANNAITFERFTNAGMQPQQLEKEFDHDMGERTPIFDIKVKAQKQSPFSRISQNELGVQFYTMGIFNPQMADQATAMLEMMEFEGKDALIEKIKQNSVIPKLAQMAAMLAGVVGSAMPKYGMIAQEVMQMASMMGVGMAPGAGTVSGLETNPLGDAVQSAKGNTAAKAADKAAEMAAVK